MIVPSVICVTTRVRAKDLIVSVELGWLLSGQSQCANSSDGAPDLLLPEVSKILGKGNVPQLGAGSR
jgi:hypothetical protein